MTKIAGMHNFPFELRPVCALTMTLGNRVVIGDTPDGIHLTGYLNEGRVSGPRISGRILPGSADWARMRHDGVLEPEVKLIVRTDDEALIQLSYVGLVDMGPEGWRRMARGERPGRIFHPRTVVRMLSTAPAYGWVNRSQFVGIGYLDYEAGTGSIDYDIYELGILGTAARQE
jgi:hypothetical protein